MNDFVIRQVNVSDMRVSFLAGYNEWVAVSKSAKKFNYNTAVIIKEMLDLVAEEEKSGMIYDAYLQSEQQIDKIARTLHEM